MGEKIDDLIDSFDESVVSFEEVVVKPELLLHPNIPKPLHGLAPRVLMGAKLWDITRRKVYKDASYRCEACGIQAEWDSVGNKFAGTLKLHAHETYEIDYDKCRAELDGIYAVCPTCHEYIHSGRVQSLYDKGVLDEEDCWNIFNHGDRVLMDSVFNPLDKVVDSRDYELEWSAWRLLYNGKEYKGKFEVYEDWVNHYKEG